MSVSVAGTAGMAGLMKERSCFTVQTAFVTNLDGNASIGVRSLFYSADPNPLTLWEQNVPTGNLLTVSDTSIHCNVLELTAENASDNYIATPVHPFVSLHIRQPIFVMVVKNIHRWFTFQLIIMDSDGVERKLRGSTLQTELLIEDQECTLPLHFTAGWNQVQIDLNDFTTRCFQANYSETMSVKVSSNCQLHRIYFCDKSNNNHPHKFCSSSMLHSVVDSSPGGSGDGFDVQLQPH